VERSHKRNKRTQKEDAKNKEKTEAKED